jgi:FKBP-type peptidyl-prolyl cis-trans isomerase FkpA
MKRSKGLIWFFLFVVVAVGCDKSTVTLNSEEQLEYDINLIDEYLAANGITNAVKLENGMRYVMSVMGTGPTPTKDNCFTVNYTGRFLDAEEAFDSGTGWTRPLKSPIAGWQIMLKLMPVGSKVTVWIPSQLAYGVDGYISIPPNTVLMFDLELLAISSYHAAGNYCY